MSNRGKLAFLVFAVMILVILVFRYISKDDQSPKNEFVNLTLTLKDDINSNTGKYTKDDYLFFYSNEYKAKFVIPSNVYFVSERNLLENISKNDVLKVFIGKNVLPLLSNENKKVTVFGLTLNDKLIYSPDTYKIGESKQTKRMIVLYGTLLSIIFLYTNEKLSKKNKIILAITLFSFLTLLFLTKQI